MSEKCSRRKFIRASSVGATALAVGGIAQSPGRAFGYVARDEINPAISNLRVVFVQDDAMTNGTGVVNDWPGQNAVTNDAVVAANMDKLACALAQQADAATAWRTIFRKPPAKQWNQVVVALKSNHIAVVGGVMAQTTRNAVMKKFCDVLANVLGVAGSNIHIFDGVHGGNMSLSPWYGLPAGVRIENTWGGTGTTVTVPPPFGGQTGCVASIANGTVDILINLALCKGHSSEFGSCTLSLKNNYGTLTPAQHGAPGTNYLLSINKSEAILGAMDSGTGRILFPRQQLCFIDALWASQNGPVVYPSVRPNRFFMGTFGPALDYQVATKFRRDTMGWGINGTVVDRFLSEFGYGPGDLPNGGQLIDAMRWLASGARPDWTQYR